MRDNEFNPIIDILVIEKNKNIHSYLQDFFSDKKFKFSFSKNNHEALLLLKSQPFEIIITDSNDPSNGDYEVINYVKDVKSDSCVLVTSECTTLEEALLVLKAGAYDFIPKPFDNETIKIILNKAIERQSLYKERDHFKNLSILDDITKVYNHRHFKDLLKIEMGRSERFNHSLSLIMVDIDDFKFVNDNFGHVIGDKILKEFAKSLQKSVRTIDHLCRYGGDEFVIILPETNKEGSYNLAKRLSKSVIHKEFCPNKKEHLSICLSMGVASYPVDAQDKESLIVKADTALYDAKKFGKNKICLFSKNR